MKIFLVVSDQYEKVGGSFAATYSDTAVEAAFSSKEKAKAFIEIQPRKNHAGPLYWRVQELLVDVVCPDKETKERTMKYTLGPLSIKKAEDSDDPDWAIVDANDKVIGEAFNLVCFDTYRPAEANARLWAAAPDLLAERDALREACKVALDALGCDRVRQDRLEAQEIIHAALGASDERNEK